MSQSLVYKEKIKELIKNISVSGKTLEEWDNIHLYSKSSMTDNSTEVHIYRATVDSTIQDTVTNKRNYTFTIRVITNAVDKEEEAQEFVDTVFEEILTILEKNLNDPSWFYLDNLSIPGEKITFSNNYYTQQINVSIIDLVNVEA